MAIILTAGIGAGIMNTVGGGGSILTLPALMFFGGLSGPDANATNRIGIIPQNVMAIYKFRQGGVRGDSFAWPIVLISLPFALMGAWLATFINAKDFNTFLGILMLALLVPILVKPPSKLTKDEDAVLVWSRIGRNRQWLVGCSFALVGLYAGFIQAGAGLIIIAVSGMLMRMNLLQANYLKLILVLLWNVAALLVFSMSDLNIHWSAGLAMFIGQVIGAWMGSWVALKKGESWIKVILVLSILISSAKLLGLLQPFGL